MGRPARSPGRKKTRTRREAGEAREAILDAAERRLISAGPSGIRLQEVAADVGVSHPTVLHHFGSREALVRAVVQRAMGNIKRRLIEVASAAPPSEAHIRSMLDSVFEALASGGQGRVILWLALESHFGTEEGVTLGDIVGALHAVHAQTGAGGTDNSRDDVARVVVLAALALIAGTVIGPVLMERAGLPHDQAGQAEFRQWLAHLLADHLQTDGGPSRL